MARVPIAVLDGVREEIVIQHAAFTPAFHRVPQGVRILPRPRHEQFIDRKHRESGGNTDPEQRQGEAQEADAAGAHGNQFVVLAEVRQAKQQPQQQRHRHDQEEHFRENNQVVVDDRAEAGVVLDEFVKRAKKIDDDHQHGERVEAIQQRPGKFTQQIFVENPHVSRVGKGRRSREKKAARDSVLQLVHGARDALGFRHEVQDRKM